jgi:CDP-glycerol glycerophosphotransferase (TagB/SpsB family)
MKVYYQFWQFVFFGISRILPRNKKLFVYADNNLNSSIYLFCYASEQDDGFEHVYITPYEEVKKKLSSLGYKVALRWSLYGLYVALRASVYVVSSSKGQINNHLSKGAILINLWHGISVKKIGLMTYKENKKYQDKLKEFSEYKLIPSTSWLTQKCFMEAFAKSAEETPVWGEARNDFLVRHKGKINSDYLSRLLGLQCKDYRKIVGYFPTFRDYGLWDSGIDYDTLNSQLLENNDLLIIKPHPKDAVFNEVEDRSNIKIIKRSDGWQDAYEMLVGIDVLITDYSSLAYEYILLERPVILYTPDYDKYVTDRELWIEYMAIAPSKPVSTFQDLSEELNIALSGTQLPEKYFEVLENLHEVRDGSSCKKIYEGIKKLLAD